MTDTISDAALEPCPFCGATPFDGPTKKMIGQDGEPFQRYRVWCPHRHATVDEMNKEQAFRVWNRRTSGSAVEARRVAPAGVGAWQKIEHPYKPQQADYEREVLQKRIAQFGHHCVVETLTTWGLMQPEQGSFAGALWALAEWAKTQIAVTPTIAEDATVAPQPAPVEAEPVAQAQSYAAVPPLFVAGYLQCWEDYNEPASSDQAHDVSLDAREAWRKQTAPTPAHPPKVTEAGEHIIAAGHGLYEAVGNVREGERPLSDEHVLKAGAAWLAAVEEFNRACAALKGAAHG